MIRVIIADDHQMFIDGLKSLLQGEAGIEIAGETLNGENILSLLKSTKANLVLMDISMPGKTGIELAKTFKPDLIICDVLMPEMDGHEVLRLLIESELTCNIPFIFSTSVCEKYDRTEALKLGADDYIIKPFDMEIFLQMIEKWTNSDIPNKQRSRNCMV